MSQTSFKPLNRVEWGLLLVIVAMLAFITYRIVLNHSVHGTDAKPSSNRILSTGYMSVWIDPQTGCHYLVGNGPPIYRMDPNGRQVCGAVK